MIEDDDYSPSAYKTIGWCGNGARLKNYSSATKMNGPSTIKIELEVYDSYTLHDLIGDLERIEKRQKSEAQAAKAAAKPARAPKKLKAEPAPLMLTYRGEE